MNQWRTIAMKHNVAFVVCLFAPRVSQCPRLFEKHILYVNPATRLPSEVQAASARPNCNSIATYIHWNQKLLQHTKNADRATNATQIWKKLIPKLYQYRQHTTNLYSLKFNTLKKTSTVAQNHIDSETQTAAQQKSFKITRMLQWKLTKTNSTYQLHMPIEKRKINFPRAQLFA